MRDEGKSWKYTRLFKSLGDRRHFKTIEDGAGQPIEIYLHENVVMEPISRVMEDESISEEQAYVKYFDKIFRDTNAQSSIRTRVMAAVDGLADFVSIDYVPRTGRNKGKVQTLYYKGRNCDLIAWLSDVAVKKRDKIVKFEKAGTYWEGFPLNNLTKEGGVLFPQGKKPEALIRKVLDLATTENDLVLDSFGGSGTTAAVAHKMNRRWIMVELGDHCYSHIIPRLRKVIDGEDQGGITKAVDWKGGGGFRFYELAPSLLKKDKWDNYIINPEYNAEMLAEAMCKQLGFSYEPSDSIYWMHGHSTENDFLYVTTQNLTRETLQAISDEVGDERTLLICCKAFRAGSTEFPNLTLQKIPNAILSRCEWDKDDYSLQIENLPMREPEVDSQPELFGAGGEDEQ